jgi:lipoprotein NlpI
VPAERAKACATILTNPAIRPGEAAVTHYFRGFALKDLNQSDDAFSEFTEAIRLDAELWPSYWPRAEILAARRDYGRAAADLTELIRRNPQIGSLYSMRGADLDNQGQPDAAVADFTKAIELATPKDPLAEFYEGRANVFEGSHQWEKALTDYSEAIRRDDSLSFAYAGRGRVEFLTGDFAAAITDLTKAADGDASNKYTLLWLFLAQLRTGKDAVAELQRHASQMDLKQWPGPIIQIFLGELRPEQVQPPALPAAWDEAAQKAGANCEVSFYTAELSLAKKQRDRAVSLFKASVNTGVAEYIEYRAAGYELERMTR